MLAGAPVFFYWKAHHDFNPLYQILEIMPYTLPVSAIWLEYVSDDARLVWKCNLSHPDSDGAVINRIQSSLLQKRVLSKALLLIQPETLWRQYVWKWVGVSKSSPRQNVLYHKQSAVPKLMRSLSWVCGPIDCHFSSFCWVSLFCHAELF